MRRLGLVTATALVVASMIGTGVFTTTGFLIRDVQSIPAVLFCWVVGGVTALAGALAYAELASAIPHNGGEYQLLSRIYHPAVGVVAGWASLFVGFAAPIAAGSLAFGEYLSAIWPAIPPKAAGLAVLVSVAALHAVHVGAGSRFQDVFTIVKVALIVLFIAVGLAAADFGRLSLDLGRSFSEGVLSTKFAIGLIFVAFAYSGWNAAAYVAGEVERPERNLPLAFLWGTAIVTGLYILLNVVFLTAAPPGDLSGKVEVGHFAAIWLFGDTAGRVVSSIIAIGLLSTIGAMVMTGARVLAAMGADYPRIAVFARRTEGGGPPIAVLIETAISIAMLLTASFDSLLEYTGFTISIGLLLGVLGVIVLRVRSPDLPRPYRTWGYPVTPIAYALLASWMIAGTLIDRPIIALAGLGTIFSGVLLYAAIRQSDAKA